MNWIRSTYRYIVDHLTKALGVIGATLLGADATGYLEGVKAAALQYLPPDIATQLGKWIGITIFVGVFARGWYTGWKSRQEKAGVLPPPDPSIVVKALFIACAIAVGLIAPRAYAAEGKWMDLPPSAAQAQASALAAEAVQPSSEALTSVLVVVQCHVAVSVIDIDATGKMHQWDLDGRSKTDLTEHLQGALKAGATVMSDNVGCPGNPAKDTPVL